MAASRTLQDKDTGRSGGTGFQPWLHQLHSPGLTHSPQRLFLKEGPEKHVETRETRQPHVGQALRA